MTKRILGENRPSAKLTEKDIKKILSLKKQGLSDRKIAVKFGVANTTINNIFRGRTWGHVTGKGDLRFLNAARTGEQKLLDKIKEGPEEGPVNGKFVFEVECATKQEAVLFLEFMNAHSRFLEKGES